MKYLGPFKGLDIARVEKKNPMEVEQNELRFLHWVFITSKHRFAHNV